MSLFPPRPILVSLSLALLAGGGIGVVVPTDGGHIMFLVALMLTALAGLICGPTAAMFASTRSSAVATGAFTGFVAVAWSWVLGLGALIAVLSVEEFQKQEAGGFSEQSVNLAFYYATSGLHGMASVMWVGLVLIATVLGAMGGALVPLSEARPVTRLPPLFPPLLLAVFLTVVAMFFSYNHVTILSTDVGRRDWIMRLAIGQTCIAPTLAFVWAGGSAGRHLAHNSVAVRRLGGFGSAVLLVVWAVDAGVGMRFLPPWTLPYALAPLAFGGIVGAIWGWFTATGADTAPRWRDVGVDTCVSVVLLVVLIGGCSGYLVAFGVNAMLTPVALASDMGDLSLVAPWDVRGMEVRHALLMVIPYSWWASSLLFLASAGGVTLQRWLLRLPRPTFTSPDAGTSPAEPSLDQGPYGPPRSG